MMYRVNSSLIKMGLLMGLTCLAMNISGCRNENATAPDGKEPVTLLIAAAASLKNTFDEKLIPAFENQYPHIHIEATYDSSGKLKTQIEEGLEADLFISAAKVQMNELSDKKLVDSSSVVDLLENKIVLIIPAGSSLPIHSFESLSLAQTIAIGDPGSVPAGQYAKEVLTSLNLWETLKDKYSCGTNVTEVLNWVAEGSADAGIVYATDAASTDRVTIAAQAPEDSLKEKVLYPAAVISSGRHKKEAELFLSFLSGEAAEEIFIDCGFTPANGRVGSAREG